MGIVDKVKELINVAAAHNLAELKSKGVGWSVYVTRSPGTMQKRDYSNNVPPKPESAQQDTESPDEWTQDQLLEYIALRGHIWRKETELPKSTPRLPKRYKLVAAYGIGCLASSNQDDPKHIGDSVKKGDVLGSLPFSNLDEAYSIKCPTDGILCVDPPKTYEKLTGHKDAKHIPVDYGQIIAVIDTYHTKE